MISPPRRNMPPYLEKYGGIFFRLTAEAEVEEGRMCSVEVLGRCRSWRCPDLGGGDLRQAAADAQVLVQTLQEFGLGQHWDAQFFGLFKFGRAHVFAGQDEGGVLRKARHVFATVLLNHLLVLLPRMQ